MVYRASVNDVKGALKDVSSFRGTSCNLAYSFDCTYYQQEHGGLRLLYWQPPRVMEEDFKILLVDDDTDERQTFAGAIRYIRSEAKLLYASSCEDMFGTLSEHNISLIFLDINMPVIGGKECLKRLKSSETHLHIPVIIYTVSERQQDIDDVYAGGAHYYAIKPYAQSNFLETMKLVLGINWSEPQPVPLRDKFVINMAFI